jgi:putative membrane protein
MMQRKNTLSLAVAVMMAGGSLCLGQAKTGENLGERRAPAQPQGQDKNALPVPAQSGDAQPAAARTTNADRSDQAQPAAAHEHAAMSTDSKQVDQQAEQQLQKIQQQKDGMAGDRLFVLEAGLGGHFEVALAQQALQKSQDPQVKQIAQRLIQDHQQANQQLASVAQKLQVDVPMGLTSMKQQKLQIIGSMDGKAYDQKFIACMDALHAHDVHEFRSTTVTAKSPEVKQFASQTLPKLQEHHQQIKQSATALGLMSDTDAQPASGKLPTFPVPTDPSTPRSDATTPATPSAGSGSTPSTPTPSPDGTRRTPSPVVPENRPDAGRPASGNNIGTPPAPSGGSTPGGR